MPVSVEGSASVRSPRPSEPRGLSLFCHVRESAAAPPAGGPALASSLPGPSRSLACRFQEDGVGSPCEALGAISVHTCDSAPPSGGDGERMGEGPAQGQGAARVVPDKDGEDVSVPWL